VYTKDVDLLEGAAFELLLIDELSRYARPKAAFEYLKREHRGPAKRLGLRFVGRRPLDGLANRDSLLSKIQKSIREFQQRD